MTSQENALIQAYGLLEIASARKKVYALKARMEGEEELSRLLFAMAESEAVQARRLFHSLRGKVDMSKDYVRTVFEQEIPVTVEMISENLLEMARKDNTPMIQALSQLRSVERRNQAFFSPDDGRLKITPGDYYLVCQFCGYIASGTSLPECCPVCGASNTGFKECKENIK